MTIKHLFWKIGLPLLIIAACSPAAPTPTSPPAAAGPTETVMLAPTQALPTATVALPTDAPPTALPPTQAPTDVPATEVAATLDLPGLPSAPAAPDEYRSDPETLVGATGRPQLLEFFTYW